MRRSAAIGIVALIAVTFCLSAAANSNIVDHPTKWIQEPDLSWDGSFNIQSQWNPDNTVPGAGYNPGVIKADDWICNGLPITDIHWWGSYINNDQMAVTGFWINVYDNDQSGDLGSIEDDQPGTLLLSWFVPFADANEAYFNENLALTTKPAPDDYEDVYQYSWDLPEDGWYYQEEDKKYWLSIVAVTPGVFGSAPMWGWHPGLEPVGLATTNAVTGNVLSGSPVGEGYSDQWAHMEYNMAFVLTTIPEPQTYALMGFGVLGLLALRRRKRK